VADISNPQHVAFANTRCRPFADAVEQCYQTARRFQQEYAAVNGAGIPNTADYFADGSDVDGRKRMTGAMAQTLKSFADSLVGWLETGTPSRITQVQQVSVNGVARF